MNHRHHQENQNLKMKNPYDNPRYKNNKFLINHLFIQPITDKKYIKKINFPTRIELIIFLKIFCVLHMHLEKDQQPVVPQPTNYKPKVINDIKAQVNKGRLAILFIILNYMMYIVLMHD